MPVRAPALPLAVAVAAGALCGSEPRPILWGTLAAVGLATATWLGVRGHRGYLASLCVVLAFGCLGRSSRDLRALERDPPEGRRLRELHAELGDAAFTHPVCLSAELRREPAFGTDAAQLALDVDRLRLHGGLLPTRGLVLATVGGEALALLEPLATGDRVEVWGRLRAPRSFRNPGSFDVEAYLERTDVDLYLSVKSAHLVERVTRGSPFRSALSRLRSSARRRLEAAFGSDVASRGLVLALVTGDRSRLLPELESLYQRAGIFHVMAISGAHVAVLALLVLGVLRRGGMDEIPALWVLLMLLPLYAALTGARPPVLRAVVMSSMVIGARLLSLDRPRLNALALGALLLLLWQPLSLSDPGFQLSFAAMAAIVLLAEPLSRRFRFLGFLAAPLAISLAAQVGVLPFAAWHFHRVTPWAPFASLVAMPLASVLVVLGLLIAFLPPLGWLSSGLVAMARGGALALTETASLTAALPAATLAVPRPSAGASLLYALAVIVFLSARPLRARPKLWLRSGAVVLLATAVVASPVRPSAPAGLTLTAIDVGHGDALLVRLPDGSAMLVDGGGATGSSFDVGERVVVPFLLDQGVRNLAAVVVTHADYDHLGGLFAVVDSLRVGALWEGAPRWDRPLYRTFRHRARDRGVPFRELEENQSFDFGGARFEVLAAGGRGQSDKENDRSLVMRVSYAGRSLLLTGDAERGLEADLLRRRAHLRADILKVGHHGSRSSSTPEFLFAVDPSLAIISARARPGPGWPIPSARVLSRLKAMGIEYLRTDTEGAVTVTITPAGAIRISTQRAADRRP